MTRRKTAGARGHLTLSEVLELGCGHVIQPKIDGAYAQLELDDGGCIETVRSSTGRVYSEAVVGDLVGCRVATGAGVLVGELEAHTERGISAAAGRGFAVVHLFDALQLDGRDLTRDPYSARRDALHRDRAGLEVAVGDDRPWTVDQRGVCHDGAGRFATVGVPRAWRRAPLVPQYPIAKAGELWEKSLAGELEGLVAVALAGRVGSRGAKRKCKPVDGLDCVVVDVDARRARVRSFGRIFTVGVGSHTLTPGDVIEVRHEGFHDSGRPRFPRVSRRRADLVAAG